MFRRRTSVFQHARLCDAIERDSRSVQLSAAIVSPSLIDRVFDAWQLLVVSRLSTTDD